MSTQSIIELLSQPEIKNIFQQAGIKHLWLFGSYAKGTAKPDSDIDLLYQTKPGVSLGLGFLGYSQKIEQIVGKHIDLIHKGSLNHRIKKDVLSHTITVF